VLIVEGVYPPRVDRSQESRRALRRRPTARAAWLAGLLGLMTALTGAPGRTPAAEKVAVVAVGTTLINLNPLTHIVSTMRVMNNLLFDGLTRFDDDTYQPKPDLAESWTVSPDGREYVFKLRRGVVFHDGSRFSAHDVKWSWEVICHKDNPRIADLYVDHYRQIRGCREYHEGQAAGVDGIEVADDYTLRVHLTEPYAPFLVSTAVTGILPRTRYASIPVAALLQHPLSRAPIGTGPFSYVDWKEGDRLVLKANPRYFLGKPKLDGLVIRFIPDPAAQLIEFKNGTLHFAFFSPVLPADFDAAKADPRLVARAYSGVWNYFAAVDHTNPLFTDGRVRQALALAIDRRRILTEQWGGYGAIVNSPINPSLPAFDQKLSAPPYDPVKAKALLAAGGWRPGADGILVRDGRRFAFSIVNFAGPSRNMAIVYQDFWRKLGMDVSVDTVDFPTLWGVRFHPGKFAAISFLWPSGFYPDPAVGLYPFLCANSRSGYCSAEMDRLIVAGRSALDPAERLRTYTRFQELFARDLPFMWVVSPADLRLASPKLILPVRQNDFLVMKAILDWDLKE
jgi:peptide/nickel transport system substrate-binding protein